MDFVVCVANYIVHSFPHNRKPISAVFDVQLTFIIRWYFVLATKRKRFVRHCTSMCLHCISFNLTITPNRKPISPSRDVQSIIFFCGIFYWQITERGSNPPVLSIFLSSL